MNELIFEAAVQNSEEVPCQGMDKKSMDVSWMCHDSCNDFPEFRIGNYMYVIREYHVVADFHNFATTVTNSP